jgi:ribonuclease HI
MELTAVINALKFFNNNTYSKCIIYSDSQYVINTINNNWKRNKNNDLWEQLDSLISSNIKFVWVKGHDGNEMNEKADKLAVCGSELFIP